MTREQAINYLICRGITEYQVSEIVRALTYKPRDCANCKHYIVKDTRTNWGSQETTKIYGCERWECEYEPTTKNDLGVDAVNREAVLDLIADYDLSMGQVVKGIHALPSVTPQEPILDKIRAEIEPKCDRINSLASVLPYTAHREIQELLCEIIDLCKAEIEVEDGKID